MTPSDQVFDPSPVRRPAETFAFTVVEYDLAARKPAVLGRRVDTGDMVRLTLAPQGTESDESVYRRPEVMDLAAPRGPNSPATEPGGVLLASTAYLMNDGSWAANWLQPLSHFPGEADVFIAMCSVIETRPGQSTDRFPNGHPNYMVQFLSSGHFDGMSDFTLSKLDIVPPFKVNSLQALHEAGEHLLGNKIGFGIRLSAPFDAVEIHPWPSRQPDGTTLEPLQALTRAIKAIQIHAPDLASGQCLCEVIPFQRVFAGAATAGHFATSPAARARLSLFNTYGDRTRTPGAFRESHFAPAIVAVRLSRTAEHRPFVTHVEPLRGFRPFASMKEAILYTATEHFAPVRPDVSPASQPLGERPTGPQATRPPGTPPPNPSPEVPGSSVPDISAAAPRAPAAISNATTVGRYQYRPGARGAR